ncbi:MAG: cobalamin B12-binding domain-containing protein [Candidatus Sericytochromatia bacterium]|nr:cobalamin B12-binding domain-containing protein [Candidatus Sericytochromatia bacterium]
MDWVAVRERVLHLAVTGEQGRLIQTVESLHLPLIGVYEQVFEPVFAMIEDAWFANRLSLSHEQAVFRLLERVASSIVPWNKDTKPWHLLGSAVADEGHDIGIRMATNLFEEAGWDVLYLGADAPADFVLSALEIKPMHTLALGISLDDHLPAAMAVLTACRAQHPAIVRIVGGKAAARHAERFRAIGVDLVAPPLSGLVERVERLVSTRPFPVPQPPAHEPPPRLPSEAA